MSHYAIGDLQGCYAEFTALLNQIQFNPSRDTLWLVGDIVNRGPQSLECLQYCMRHESSVQIVLGNHDLHLLALMHGYGKLKHRDTLDSILNHPQMPQMRDWLRQQPLMRHTASHALVHAGIHPDWSIPQAQALANEVAAQISGSQARTFFAQMYGNHPSQWQPESQGIDRLRFITNVFTRMRVLNPDNSLDYDYKETYDPIPAPKRAWFDAPHRQHTSHEIIFGHWSALGYRREKHIWALDTGALWGEELTAVNIHTGERFTQPSFQRKQFE